ncbi:MAG: SRPBCC domain-containing protein [Pseudomonadota bacterium]
MKTIYVEQTVHAPLARIWRACTEAHGLAAWQADEITGVVSPGSQLRLRWPSLGVAIELKVEQLEPMRRIVFQSEDSQLELKIAANRVSVEHRADFDDDESEGTLSSWRLSLATLAHYLEHHDGRTRAVHWAVQRAAASLEDAHAFFTLAGAQSGWLTRSAAANNVGAVGSEIALELAWGPSLNGQVLSHSPPRDVLLSWKETNHSLLALRTLPCPQARNERLLAATWSTWDVPDTAPTLAQLQAALSRLSRILDNRATA